MNRYEIRSWVADTGVWDNLTESFVGPPYNSSKIAIDICKLMNEDIKEPFNPYLVSEEIVEKWKKEKMHFFMPMKKLPRTTHQQKKVNTKGKKPVFYEPDDLKAARAKLTAYIAPHTPKQKYTGAVRLIVKWCYPATKRHKHGEWKITSPDTDNLNKLPKDIMQKLGFWSNDAIVASEVIEKFYSVMPGIYIEIEELGGNR